MKPVTQAGSNFSTVFLDASPPPSRPTKGRFESPFCLAIIFQLFLTPHFLLRLRPYLNLCVFIHLHHHHCLFLHLHLRLWLRFLLTLLSLHSFVQVFAHFAPRKRNEPATTPGSSLSYFLHPHFRSPTSQRR